MTIMTPTLRERALIASQDADASESARLQAQRVEHWNLRVRKLREAVADVLGIDVPVEDIHTLAGDQGEMEPAWMDPDTKLLFSIKSVIWEGYRLHLVQSCRSGHQRSWFRIRALKDLGWFLKFPPACWICRGAK